MGALQDPLRITRDLAIPLREIELRASRSSGPGGQHANVTASRIEAVFDVRASATLTEAQRERLASRLGPVVRAVAQDARSRELALERLRERIARGLAVRRPRHATKPSRGAREDRLRDKRRQAQRKSERRRPADD